jgi:hypothetical protein
MADEYLLGVTAMRNKLTSLIVRVPGEVAAALYVEAQIEMTEAKRRTPWEFGVLKASGHTSLPLIEGREIRVMMRFGGAAAGYAIYVHEDMEAFHPRGGQAKFLESTLLESAPHMAKRVAHRMDLNKLIA